MTCLRLYSVCLRRVERRYHRHLDKDATDKSCRQAVADWRQSLRGNDRRTGRRGGLLCHYVALPDHAGD